MNSDDVKALAGGLSPTEPLALTVERGCQMLLGISLKRFRLYQRIANHGWPLHTSKMGQDLMRVLVHDAWAPLCALVKELDNAG